MRHPALAVVGGGANPPGTPGFLTRRLHPLLVVRAVVREVRLLMLKPRAVTCIHTHMDLRMHRALEHVPGRVAARRVVAAHRVAAARRVAAAHPLVAARRLASSHRPRHRCVLMARCDALALLSHRKLFDAMNLNGRSPGGLATAVRPGTAKSVSGCLQKICRESDLRVS